MTARRPARHLHPSVIPSGLKALRQGLQENEDPYIEEGVQAALGHKKKTNEAD